MTTKTSNQSKKNPDFHIFAQGADGNTSYIGAVFNHAKGNGFNILIGNHRYVAFPAKAKSVKG